MKLTPDTFTFFVFFVLPGFVAVTTYDLLVAGPRRETAKRIIEMAGISFANIILVSPLAVFIFSPRAREDHIWEWYLALVVSLLLAPIVEAVLFRALRSTRYLRRLLIQPTATGWDFFFGQRQPCWLRFALKSGGWVGGYCGGRSYVTSFPQPPQVYLEAEWAIDFESGRLLNEVEATLGVIISLEECEFVQILSTKEVLHVEKGTPGRLPAGTGTAQEGVSARAGAPSTEASG